MVECRAVPIRPPPLQIADRSVENAAFERRRFDSRNQERWGLERHYAQPFYTRWVNTANRLHDRLQGRAYRDDEL